MVELENKSLKVFDWILFIKFALVFLFFFLFYNKLLTELKTTTCWPVTCTSILTKNYAFCSLLSVTEVYRKKLINNFFCCVMNSLKTYLRQIPICITKKSPLELDVSILPLPT